MSVTITTTLARPSSLPLPKIMSHSDPAARFLQKRLGIDSHPLLMRTKLRSTSTGGSPTPGSSPAGTPTGPMGMCERQVKSLTPEREARAVRQCRPVRKVSCSAVQRNGSFKSGNNNNNVVNNNNNNNSVNNKTKESSSSPATVVRSSAPASGPASSAGQTRGTTSQQATVQAQNKKNATISRKKSNEKERSISTSSSRTTSANSIVTNGSSNNKPDLVKGVDNKVQKKKNGGKKASATAEEKTKKEEEEKKALVKSQKEVSDLREMVRFNARAFEAMAVTLDHVTNKLNGMEAPELDKSLKDLKEKLETKEGEVARLESLRSEDVSRLTDETSRFQYDTDAVIKDCNGKVERMRELHRRQVDQVISSHHSELQSLADARIVELTRQDDRHSLELDELAGKFKSDMSELDAKWGAKLLSEIESKNEEMRTAEWAWTQKEEIWEESRRSLEEQIHALKVELRDHEAALTKSSKASKNKDDARVTLVQQKLITVTAEVDSLKAVLELKSDETKRLRIENIHLEEKLEQFDAISLELRKANALVEDLKEQIQTKTCLERKLSAENHKLYTSVERAHSEKKRISMENEELHWKIRQSTEQLSMSFIEVPSCSSGGSSLDSNPCHPSNLIRQQLSCSFSEGCHTTSQNSTKSLPPFFSGRLSRPQSGVGPDCSFDTHHHQGQSSESETPDSPRVLEVIKKAEAVSWKIEYEEGGSTASSSAVSSPMMVKRKLSPSVNRSGSVRQRKTPMFETVCETSSEEENKEVCCKTPEPVNIVSEAEEPHNVGDSDISSSSEIEIDEAPKQPEEKDAKMNASLPSYDLQRLFAGGMSAPKASGGEALIMQEEEEPETASEEEEEVSAVSWSEGME